ncbi:probable ion channel CASTOR isoform X4 [Dendrobium catenatum]|uniref:probable ion channel CASTOR isoform X4 n=1 Tax=Dendrobium catenatum TaxID=906689 RepID=UPI00109FCFD5|nr:probable ion channel CASTOR isoform X4 [Dendrobium catenatum]
MAMSLDSESSPPALNRDWFFSATNPSFPSGSAGNVNRGQKARRKSSAFPVTEWASKPYLREARPQQRLPTAGTWMSFGSSVSTSPATSAATEPPAAIPRGDLRYAGLRRKVRFDTREEKGEGKGAGDASAVTNEMVAEAASEGRRKGFWARLVDRRMRVQVSVAIFAALVLLCFTSVLQKNFLLNIQVNLLQDQLSKQKLRLQKCDLYDPEYYVEAVPPVTSYLLQKSLKNSALFASLAMLCFPLLVLRHLDKISRFWKSSDSEEISLNKQLAYKVDVFLSVYPFSKPLTLLLATLLLLCLGGLALFGVTDGTLADCMWLSWTYVADSGNHANSVGTGPKLVSVSITFGGMLIFAMMLGLVSDAISEKFDSLRKGRSEVIEKNHTLILGWSDKLGSLLNQLAIANENLGGGIVVVMAERDKEEMELDIAKMEFDFRGTSVICRSGSPLILADLKKVSVSKAHAIIVLAEDGNADLSDARALRTVLSLTGVKDGLKGHIVVELSDIDNEVLVKLVGGDLVETVVAHDVIGRLMIQCARQPGLAQIWEDILGFENCEFYIKKWPQLYGLQFEEVLISFPDAVPCGIKVSALGGKIILNPDDHYVLQEEDEVLVIAEDDDTYAPSTLPKVYGGHLPRDFTIPKSPEKILFCGWRRDIEDMIMVLDAFLAPESELWMFNEVPESDREKKLIDGGLDFIRLENISLVHREGNAVIRRHLESLPLESFDSILILADESVEDSAMQADSRSLATLLLIRDIQARRLPFKEAMVSHIHPVSFFQGSWIGEMQQASDNSRWLLRIGK